MRVIRTHLVLLEVLPRYRTKPTIELIVLHTVVIIFPPLFALGYQQDTIRHFPYLKHASKPVLDNRHHSLAEEFILTRTTHIEIRIIEKYFERLVAIAILTLAKLRITSSFGGQTDSGITPEESLRHLSMRTFPFNVLVLT
jgi:hypothetical protein